MNILGGKIEASGTDIKDVSLKLLSDTAVALWVYGFAFSDAHPFVSILIVTVTTIWLTLFTLVNGWGWMIE